MIYDERFRLCVIKYKDSGHTFSEMREAFGVDDKCYYRWKKRYVETGGIKNNYPAEHKGKIDKAELLAAIEEHPDWYLREYAEKFNVCLQAIHKLLKSLGVTRKKKLLVIPKGKRSGEKNTGKK